MPARPKKKEPEVLRIEKALAGEFPKVSAYRYNPASIRVRVIDDRFKGMNRLERERLVRPLIHALPEEIQADITILLLLAPDELSESLMNLEFEHPSPSLL
jgi:stress-induced morphogen